MNVDPMNPMSQRWARRRRGKGRFVNWETSVGKVASQKTRGRTSMDYDGGSEEIDLDESAPFISLEDDDPSLLSSGTMSLQQSSSESSVSDNPESTFTISSSLSPLYPTRSNTPKLTLFPRYQPQRHFFKGPDSGPPPLDPAGILISPLPSPIGTPTISARSSHGLSTPPTQPLSRTSTGLVSYIPSGQLSHTSLNRDSKPDSLSYLLPDTQGKPEQMLRTMTPRPTFGQPSSGWPQPEYIDRAPATPDRKSRFFPKLMSWTAIRAGHGSRWPRNGFSPSSFNTKASGNSTSTLNQNQLHGPIFTPKEPQFAPVPHSRSQACLSQTFSPLTNQQITRLLQPCLAGRLLSQPSHAHICLAGMDEEECRVERRKRRRQRRSKRKPAQATADPVFVDADNTSQKRSPKLSSNPPSDHFEGDKDGAPGSDTGTTETDDGVRGEGNSSEQPSCKGLKKKRRRGRGRGKGKNAATRAPAAEASGRQGHEHEIQTREKDLGSPLEPRTDGGNARHRHGGLFDAVRKYRLISPEELKHGTGFGDRDSGSRGGANGYGGWGLGGTDEFPYTKVKGKSVEMMEWEGADSRYWVGC